MWRVRSVNIKNIRINLEKPEPKKGIESLTPMANI